MEPINLADGTYIRRITRQIKSSTSPRQYAFRSGWPEVGLGNGNKARLGLDEEGYFVKILNRKGGTTRVLRGSRYWIKLADCLINKPTNKFWAKVQGSLYSAALWTSIALAKVGGSAIAAIKNRKCI